MAAGENNLRETRKNINSTMLVAILIVAISVSPRLPLPVDIPGRLLEVRLEDIWVTILFSLYIYVLFAGEQIYVSKLFLPILCWQGYGILLTIAVLAISGGELLRALFYSL